MSQNEEPLLSGRGEEQLRHPGVMVALLSSYGMTSIGLLLTPAMHALSEDFPGIPYGTVSMLATIPNLMSMSVAFLLATKLAERVDHRLLLLTGLGLFTAGGTFPFFVHNFLLTIISRALFGIGYGVILNQSNAVSVKLYHGRKLSRLLTLSAVTTNAVCMISIVLGGVLSDYNDHTIWLVHTAGLFPFVMVLLFLPEPEHDGYKIKEKYQKKLKHRVRRKDPSEQKIPGAVFFTSACFGLAYMAQKTVMLTMSSILVEESIGTAAIAGMLLAMNRAGGLAGGAIFSLAYGKLKPFTLASAMAVQSIMIFICWRSSNLILLGAAIAMLGVTQFVMQQTITASFARNYPEVSDRAISLLMALLNLGGFLPAVFLSAFAVLNGGDDFRKANLVLLVLSVVLTLIWIARGLLIRRMKDYNFHRWMPLKK